MASIIVKIVAPVHRSRLDIFFSATQGGPSRYCRPLRGARRAAADRSLDSRHARRALRRHVGAVAFNGPRFFLSARRHRASCAGTWSPSCPRCVARGSYTPSTVPQLWRPAPRRPRTTVSNIAMSSAIASVRPSRGPQQTCRAPAPAIAAASDDRSQTTRATSAYRPRRRGYAATAGYARPHHMDFR
jgi:hypothetical protein